jgi:hypothetical protein
MKVHPSTRPRTGYATMLVLGFMVLLLSILGLTYRQIAAVLRVEAARSNQVICDQGSMQAVAQAMSLLENGPPSSDPYSYQVAIMTSAGQRNYTVMIASAGTGLWSVTASPSQSGP